jgi:hypothetical protein
MANIVQISGVQIGTGLTNNFQECLDCLNFLQQNNIDVGILNYGGDEIIHSMVFAAYSDAYRTVTDFPIILWTETYDDGNMIRQMALSLTELQNSTLIAHKDLICPVL